MVDYPSYMQNVHHYWLDGTNSGVGSGGLVKAINDALVTNPFTSLSGYNPEDDVSDMSTAVLGFQTSVSSINPVTDYTLYLESAKSLIDNIIPSFNEFIQSRLNEYTNGLDVELLTKVYPRFEAGMRDINAVNSSAFAIGRAIIEIDRTDKVSKFLSDMELQYDQTRLDAIQKATAEMVRLYLQRLEYTRVGAALTLDLKRLSIAAMQDYLTEQKAIAGDAGRWPLEVYKYGANMLAGISGGTTGSVPVDGSKTARIIGSGLSGAAAGAQIGASIAGDTGAGWGSLVGGIGGLLMGM